MGVRLSSILVSLAAGVVVAPAWGEPLLESLVGPGSEPPAPWHVAGLPGQTKPFTRFSVVDLGGRRALRIEADESYGNLVHPLKPVLPPLQLAWQWRVERPLEHADLRQKSGDDTEVKVCVFFDEPMDNLTFGERQLLRFARARSTDPVPTATICYVWDSRLPAGTAVDSPFTRRLRYIVLQSGTSRLDQWVAERRDVGADYTRVFGSESASVPPIVGVAVGADADNTKSHSIAYVAELVLEP
jgi:Protein of unknown function (DUF3047)